MFEYGPFPLCPQRLFPPLSRGFLMEPFVPRSRSYLSARFLYPYLHFILIFKPSSFACTPGIMVIHLIMHLIEPYCVVSWSVSTR